MQPYLIENVDHLRKKNKELTQIIGSLTVELKKQRTTLYEKAF